MFDFLLSADMYVPDPDATTAVLDKRLGILQHPNWRQAFPNHPYIAWFLRVHKSLAVAPTRIEPQTHLDAPNPGDPFFPGYLESLRRFHGEFRPIQTHGTVVIVKDIDPFVRRLVRHRVPFRIAPMTDEMPWERLWVGVTPEEPDYDPAWDAGLCIEVLPIWPLQMPEAVFGAPEPLNPEPGSMVRVVQKSFLVRDLDASVRTLSYNLDWEPESIEDFPDEGFRRARLGFSMPHSARVDLIEPTKWDGPEGTYLHAWGPGPYYIRISASGLDAKAEDLRQRGTDFTELPTCASVGGPRLQVNPEQLEGLIVEFVEHQPLPTPASG